MSTELEKSEPLTWEEKIERGVYVTIKDVVETFYHHLDGLDMSDEQKHEFIVTIWMLMLTSICIDFGTDAANLIQNSKITENKTGTNGLSMIDCNSFVRGLIAPPVSGEGKEKIT